MRNPLILVALVAGCATGPVQTQLDAESPVALEGNPDLATEPMVQDFLDSGAQFGVVVDPATGETAVLQNLDRVVNSSDFSQVTSAVCLDCGGVNSTCTGGAGFQRQIQVGLQRDTGSGPVDILYSSTPNWTPVGQNCNGAACPALDVDASLAPVPFDVTLVGNLNSCSAFGVFFDTEDPTPPVVPCNFCEVSGTAGGTFDCPVSVAAASIGEVTAGQAASLQFELGWDDTLLTPDNLYTEVCLGVGGGPPCFEVPATGPGAFPLPTGHSVSTTPSPLFGAVGSASVVVVNLSNPSGLITDAFLDSDGTTVVGTAEFMTLRMSLDQDIDPGSPACVDILNPLGANGVPETLDTTVQDTLMITSFP